MKEILYDSWQSIADRLGVSISTAKRYQEKGLPIMQPGGEKGRIFTTERKLLEWIELNKAEKKETR